MKKYLLGVLPFVLLCSCLEQEEEDVVAKLHHFYTYYITVNAEKNSLGASRDSLKKYCTREFLKRIDESGDLDFDPITYGQDFDKEWVKTITVSKATQKRAKIFRVSYLLDSKDKISHNIVVTMGKESGEWKIDIVRDNE